MYHEDKDGKRTYLSEAELSAARLDSAKAVGRRPRGSGRRAQPCGPQIASTAFADAAPRAAFSFVREPLTSRRFHLSRLHPIIPRLCNASDLPVSVPWE